MKTATTKIAYLHHSTGEVVWLGSTSKIGVKLGKSAVGNWITDYNKKNGTRYGIEQMNFPNTTAATRGPTTPTTTTTSGSRTPATRPIRVSPRWRC